MQETGIQFTVSFFLCRNKRKELLISQELCVREAELEDIEIASIWEVLLTARLAKFFYGEK